jgi:hypothetical protein
MVRISQTKANNVQISESQVLESEITGSPASFRAGVGGIQDSFQGPVKTSAIREIIRAASSEGKVPMTENNLNRFLKENLKPQQYAEAFLDLKAWVSNNFYLTPKQADELKTLTADDLERFRQMIQYAVDSNKEISIQFFTPDPYSSQPKKVDFVGILTGDLKDSAQEISGETKENPKDLEGRAVQQPPANKKFGAILKDHEANQQQIAQTMLNSKKTIQG